MRSLFPKQYRELFCKYVGTKTLEHCDKVYPDIRRRRLPPLTDDEQAIETAVFDQTVDVMQAFVTDNSLVLAEDESSDESDSDREDSEEVAPTGSNNREIDSPGASQLEEDPDQEKRLDNERSDNERSGGD